MKLSPYYDHAGIKIFHGDSWIILPALLSDVEVDHVITDPPYSQRTHTGARTNRVDRRNQEFIDFSSMSCHEITEVFSICASSLRGWLISFMDWQHVAEIAKHPPEDLRFVRFGIWNKTNGAPQLSGDRPAMGWEAIAILHREGRRMKWNGGGRRSVWTSPREQRVSHVAQKPMNLIRELVTQFADPDSLVLDPFMGSGTTLRAAKDLGCRAIGIEVEERYCELAANRLSQEVLF